MVDNGDFPELLAASKTKPAERHVRQQLIERYSGVGMFSKARATLPKRHVCDDDIADSYPCIFSAEHIANGLHVASLIPPD